MGNDSACKIVGIGNVLLLTSTSCRMLLKDVHHVSDIILNLILVGGLGNEGFCGSFENDIWKILQGKPDCGLCLKEKHIICNHARM
mgnify:CR=1 FL=1